MGCVSSKLLRKQASADDGLAIVHRRTAPDSCRSSSHHVCLTSTSYGFLNVGSPLKAAEKRSSDDRSKVNSSSSSSTLTEMYCKLSSLQMEQPYQNKACDEEMENATTTSMSETIDVGDMMMGLEEAAAMSSYCFSPPAKRACVSAMEPLAVSNRRHLVPVTQIMKKTFHEAGAANSTLRQTNLSCPAQKKPICRTKIGEADEHSGKENAIAAAKSSAEANRCRRKRRGKPLGPVPSKRESHVCTNGVMMKYSDLFAVKEEEEEEEEEEAEEEGHGDGDGASRTPLSVNQIPRRRKPSRGFGSGPGSPLFDPELVASYEAALENLQKQDWSAAGRRHGFFKESDELNSKVSPHGLDITRRNENGPSSLSNSTMDVHGRHLDRARSRGNGSSISLDLAMDVQGRLLLDRMRSGENVVFPSNLRESTTDLPGGSRAVESLRNSGAGKDADRRIQPERAARRRRSMSDGGEEEAWWMMMMEQKGGCPPPGSDTRRRSVVLYTTTLRGIRKTYEDCNEVRRILVEELDLVVDERDVSMHLEFLHELRELMGDVVSVPRLFIRGKYVGGVDHVRKLMEDGRLKDMVRGLPKDLRKGVCDGCGGVRFVPCLDCNGSCKLRDDESNAVLRCSECNENGLIQCPICS